ncbi:MAG TPA: hypothetical protein VLJ60_10375, partial [bacterium]|nr:hypothetical protein [bacterium]
VELFVPVWLSEEEGLIDLSREWNSKIKAFPEAPVFLNARFYKGTLGNYKIIILFVHIDGHLEETQLVVPESVVQGMREKITSVSAKEKSAVQIQETVPKKEKEETVASGRKLLRDDMGVMAELLAASIMYSGGWGATLPWIFGGEKATAKAYLSSSLLGAGIGFFAPFLALRKTDLSTGGAIGAELGGLRGALDGFLLFSLLAGFDNRDTTKIRGMTGLMTSISMTEYIAGMYIADRMNISEERMRAITLYSFIGYATGLELFFLAAGDGKDAGLNDVSRTTGIGILSGVMLAGGIGGMFGGYYLSGKAHYTNGDTVIAGTTIPVIAGLPLALASLGDDVDARIYSGVALAGTVAGTLTGHYFAKNMDFKSWQAVMVDLGTIGGALIGFGLAYLIGDDEIFRNTGKYTVPIAVGGAVGFAALMAVFAKDAKKQKIEHEKSLLSGFKINLNPYAFTMLDRSHRVNEKTLQDPQLIENYISEYSSNTMLNLSYEF